MVGRVASSAMHHVQLSGAENIHPSAGRLAQAEADRIIYVGNVSAEVDETTLRAIFENCGFVAQIRIAG